MISQRCNSAMRLSPPHSPKESIRPREVKYVAKVTETVRVGPEATKFSVGHRTSPQHTIPHHTDFAYKDIHRCSLCLTECSLLASGKSLKLLVISFSVEGM